MKREMILLALTMAAGTVLAEAPMIGESVTMTPLKDRTDAFEISYTLSGAPAVVTVDIEECESGVWSSLGGERIGVLAGDANRVVHVLDRPSKAYWFMGKVRPDESGNGQYRAIVKAWPTNMPPDYMVVNLAGTCEDPVRWYATTNDLPGGFMSPDYRKTKLLMRRIPAAGVVWMMGYPRRYDDEDAASVNSPGHLVCLTEDYYMGVFEMTQGQHDILGHGNAATSYFFEGYDYPADRIGHGVVRGKYNTSPYNWPAGRDVDPNRTIGVLRARSGIAEFDLPTVARFEYALRAGSRTGLPGDREWTKANVEKYGVFKDNTDRTTGKYAKVGSKLPNAWGLYDMLGNLYERLLDRRTMGEPYAGLYRNSLAAGWLTGAITYDPIGPEAASSSDRGSVQMGGSYFDAWDSNEAKVGYQNNKSWDWTEHPTSEEPYLGYRVCCSVGAAVK